MKLQDQIKEQLGAVLLLKSKLKEKILALADNPSIKRLKTISGPTCFTMSSSLLSGKDNPDHNFSPDYFDFIKQYEILSEEIENTEISNLYDKLFAIVNTGKLKRKTYTFKFHPHVLKALEQIIEEGL